jgi:AcrR family transcriptional regulator
MLPVMARPKPRPKRKPTAPPSSRAPGDARERILEVASAMLRDVGPDGLRLQEIARAVGVSHPAILHHFGSRAGLVRAVVERSVLALEADVARSLAFGDAEKDPAALIEACFRALSGRGHGRLLVWLALADDAAEAKLMLRIGEVAKLVHALREKRMAEVGKRAPPLQDTGRVVMLASFALLGDAICGDLMRPAMPGEGKDDPDGAAFRKWLAALLVERLETA